MKPWQTVCEIPESERDGWVNEIATRDHGDGPKLDYVLCGDSVVLKITYSCGTVRILDCKIRRHWESNQS
jgi:hypothetical protein